jgi:hypothetical protein
MDWQKCKEGAMTNDETKLPRGPIYRFEHLANARSWVDHGVKPQRIMLGDDEKFWVVCPADAARLERAGCEYAI